MPSVVRKEESWGTGHLDPSNVINVQECGSVPAPMVTATLQDCDRELFTRRLTV